MKQLVHEIAFPPRVVIETGDRTLLLGLDEVNWIEGDSKYTYFHVGEKRYSVKQRLIRTAEALDHTVFIRVHRSFLVNIRRIREVRLRTKGETLITLVNGTTLLCRGRVYTGRLQQALRQEMKPVRNDSEQMPHSLNLMKSGFAEAESGSSASRANTKGRTFGQRSHSATTTPGLIPIG